MGSTIRDFHRLAIAANLTGQVSGKSQVIGQDLPSFGLPDSVEIRYLLLAVSGLLLCKPMSATAALSPPTLLPATPT
jgi:hypothetical protein